MDILNRKSLKPTIRFSCPWLCGASQIISSLCGAASEGKECSESPLGDGYLYTPGTRSLAWMSHSVEECSHLIVIGMKINAFPSPVAAPIGSSAPIGAPSPHIRNRSPLYPLMQIKQSKIYASCQRANGKCVGDGTGAAGWMGREEGPSARHSIVESVVSGPKLP